MKSVTLTVAASALVLALGSAVPANALSWPSGGEFHMGDVTWTIGNAGIIAGTDSDGAFNTPFNLMHSPYINNGEVFDCTHNDVSSEAIVTAESNGDVTITCPSYTFDNGFGLTGQLTIRLFAPIDGVYWARSWYHFDSDVPSGSWDLASKGPNRTSHSSVSSPTAGNAAIARIWFDPDSPDASSFSEVENNGSFYQVVSEQVDDNVADFLFFDLVVVPSDNSVEAAENAVAVAEEATSEFALSARLMAGLNEDLLYSGWDVELVSDEPQTDNNELAATGIGDARPFFALPLAGVALGAALVLRRRPAHRAKN